MRDMTWNMIREIYFLSWKGDMTGKKNFGNLFGKHVGADGSL